MKKKQLLVIDACVARAAGTSEHPVSSACRTILIDVLTICHKVALNNELRIEWRKHESKFTRKWRVSMAARQKPLNNIASVSCGLDLQSFQENNRDAIEKDLHLIELALATDKVIITLDNALYDALGCNQNGLKLRSQINWINPVKDGSIGPVNAMK